MFRYFCAIVVYFHFFSLFINLRVFSIFNKLFVHWGIRLKFCDISFLFTLFLKWNIQYICILMYYLYTGANVLLFLFSYSQIECSLWKLNWWKWILWKVMLIIMHKSSKKQKKNNSYSFLTKLMHMFLEAESAFCHVIKYILFVGEDNKMPNNNIALTSNEIMW